LEGGAAKAGSWYLNGLCVRNVLKEGEGSIKLSLGGSCPGLSIVGKVSMGAASGKGLKGKEGGWKGDRLTKVQSAG